MAVNIVLLLVTGALPLFAQDAGTSSSGGTAVEHSSKTTTTTSNSTPLDNADSNTWLLIGIAVLAFLILVIALARSSSSRREVRKTTVIR